jgi:hypothetical protein
MPEHVHHHNTFAPMALGQTAVAVAASVEHEDQLFEVPHMVVDHFVRSLEGIEAAVGIELVHLEAVSDSDSIRFVPVLHLVHILVGSEGDNLVEDEVGVVFACHPAVHLSVSPWSP